MRAIAAGTAHLKKADQSAYMDDLELRASGRKAIRRATRARSVEEFKVLIGGLGVSGFGVDIRE